MDRFWASNKNKVLLEVLCRNYFVGLTSKQGVKIVLSGYVDDGYGALLLLLILHSNKLDLVFLYKSQINGLFTPFKRCKS